MANPVIGKTTYAYLAGKAIVHLKDWDFTAEAGQIDIDPDIGSTRQLSVPGFIKESGTLNFNFSSDDFANIWDMVYANTTAVALYLYPNKGSSQIYLYGNVYLTNLNHTNPLLGTVSGAVGFVSADTTGFSRQTTAA